MKKNHEIPRLLASLVLDYVRWTQVVPMLIAWGVAAGAVLLFLFSEYEQAAWGTLDSGARAVASIPWLGDWLVAWIDEKSGGDGTLDTEDLKSIASSAWIFGGLALFLAGLVLNALFGPFEPWPLVRKLKGAALASLVALVGMFWMYRVAGEQFNGGFMGWVLVFCGFAIVLFLVSLYSLSVSHGLGALGRYLRGGRADPTA